MMFSRAMAATEMVECDELYYGASFYKKKCLWVQVWMCTTEVLRNELASMPQIFLKLHGSRKIKSIRLKLFLINVFLTFFRRLSCGKKRSSCFCVSKRWLMLMSSICRAEIYKSEDLTEGFATCHDEMASVDEDLVIENDGYLSRCLEGKKATDVRLAAIVVGTSARGGLGNYFGSNTTY
ncbi:hypothetical protein V8G54_016367 [Vigna mungo]|uniref:Uncharacterized protein n=1 Tax=Vigna mungo TaxID=3915 RepID=A0AAQ3RZ97_VIGMU